MNKSTKIRLEVPLGSQEVLRPWVLWLLGSFERGHLGASVLCGKDPRMIQDTDWVHARDNNIFLGGCFKVNRN